MDVRAVASRPFQVARMLGPVNAGSVLLDRIARRQSAIAPTVLTTLYGSAGLEIGGPSDSLRVGGPLPLYGAVSSLDNINFAGETLWESELRQGGQYAPGGQVLARQMLMEATSLQFESGAYDFVASSTHWSTRPTRSPHLGSGTESRAQAAISCSSFHTCRGHLTIAGR